MRIVLVSIYPPPIGGVSAHSSRLLDYLLENKRRVTFIDVSRPKADHEQVKNMSELLMFFYLLFVEKRAIIHFHIFSTKLSVLFYLLSFKHLTVITFHNERFPEIINANSRFIAGLTKRMLNKLNKILVLNGACKKKAAEFIKDPAKLVIVDNYIPPVHIPEINHKEIRNLREQHKYIISSNAWKIIFHKGEDLYGLDLLVDLMAELIKEFDVAFVFLLPTIGEPEYLKNIIEKVETFDLKDRFLFINEQVNGTAMWAISDLFIRATNTDGHSVSVMEALQIGTPVLASDCVTRPASVNLFKTRDGRNLLEKTTEILSNLETFKRMVQSASIQNAAEEILKIYDDMADQVKLKIGIESNDLQCTKS